ncbi:MAG: RluA family pseudouridine synthase [Candidatus Brocadiae bacterium]|nr:RluA family pseudouridine synthase [Candidatus Brocadiia bacterium]
MEQRKYGFTVTQEYAGYSLCDYLVHQMIHFSQQTLKKMIHSKLVLVNGENVGAFTRLLAGDEVKIEIPLDQKETYEPCPPLEILFENAQFLVVNKPAGLAVVQERWKHDNFFKEAILQHYQKTKQEDCLPLAVHRIDKETSGAVLVAKNKQMESYLCGLFEEHKIQKEYLALVAGIPENKGRIELKIVQASDKSSKMIVSESGKEAITNYELLETFGDFSLLKVTPETGRTHQIRVHLASQGYPLAIDSLYGYRNAIKLSEIKPSYKPKDTNLERPILSRLTLHAHRISFQLPDEQPFSIEAPIPEDLELLIKMLRKYRPQQSSIFSEGKKRAR